LVQTKSEICISDGQYCGTTVNRSEMPCCDGLKCVMGAPHPLKCLQCIFKCLDCKNEINGLCGGPNDTKCCPMYGCTRNDTNPKSFGKCIPIV
jgi:hypothetical protein